MIDDQRIKHYSRLIKEKQDEGYRDLFEDNPFCEINLIITWLSEQIKNKIRSEEDIPKIIFENFQFPISLSEALRNGNVFYSQLFDDKKWIPENSVDLIVDKPFTDTVKRLYNDVWQIQNSSSYQNLVIYSELRNHLEYLISYRIGKDETLNSISNWYSVRNITFGFHSFYQTWISAIDIKAIHQKKNELIFIDSGKKLHELARIMGINFEREKHSNAYATNLRELVKKSDWEYVRISTDKSDLLSLNEDIDFKGDLLLLVDIKNWLVWLDNLHWPILQDHTFYGVNSLDVFEEIISLIVSDDLGLKTKSEYLLLSALNHYQRFLCNVTNNLYFNQGDEWNHYEKETEKEIRTNAKKLYSLWIDTELESSYNKVFNLIFKNLPVSNSKYFNGVFEWINSYSSQPFTDKRGYEPTLKTIIKLNETFQALLNQDDVNRLDIIEAVPIEKLNWQFFDKFIGMFENAQTDISFGDTLYSKYMDYIGSDFFQWNLELKFDNVFIKQVCNLSYIISKDRNSETKWQEMYSKFKCWHEGWSTENRWDYKRRRKETFTLMVGSCISYFYFEDGDKSRANKLFSDLESITISQSRIDNSNDGDDYSIVLRLLARTIADSNPSKGDVFAIILTRKLDSEKNYLIVIFELCSALKDNKINLNKSVWESVKNRVMDNFWIIEKMYDNYALKNQLNHYVRIKKELFEIIIQTDKP